MAVYDNIINFLVELINRLLLKIVIAVLLLLFGFILGRIAERFILRFLQEIELNVFLKNRMKLKINAEQLISNLLMYFIYFLAIVAALDQLGITSFILYLVSAGIILIILISFFLSTRDFVPNLTAGMYLYGKLHLKEGMKIEVNNIKGELQQIELLQTKIKTNKGDIIYIPNSAMANSPIRILK